MEEYFGEDYDDYPEEYLPYQVKKDFFVLWLFWIFQRDYPENTFPTRQKNNIFSSMGYFEYFRETFPRIPSLLGKKKISSVGSFAYFRETILKIPSQSGKTHFFSSVVSFEYFGKNFPENTFPIRQNQTIFNPWALLNISERSIPTSLRIPSLPGKKAIFHPWALLHISERLS